MKLKRSITGWILLHMNSAKPRPLDICDGISMPVLLNNRQYEKVKAAEKQAQSNNTSKPSSN